MPYHHITLDERKKIEVLLEAGHSQEEVAEKLGRPASAVSRELSRNSVGEDRPYSAREAEKRRKILRSEANKKFRKITTGSDLETKIISGLKKYWSPEQVAGRLKTENKRKPVVCHETIYQFVYKEHPELTKFFRCRKGKYRRRYGTNIRTKRREEAKKIRIDKRPAIVETRKRLGDYEGDTIVGKEKTEHILTHAERKSGYLLADKVSCATAENVRKITTKRFMKLPKKKRHTITYDNGVQFAEHETLARDLFMDVYFAFPYHSWERGTNENTNGLLRQFFPKGSLFAGVTQQAIDRAVKLINERPRKRLGYLTPHEVFNNSCSLT